MSTLSRPWDLVASLAPAWSAREGTSLLLKGGWDRVRRPGTTTGTDRGAGRQRIRCPRCGWEPGRDDLWACTCLHAWNTFDTGGVCPACGREWAETQCLRCSTWSPHEDWYADEA